MRAKIKLGIVIGILTLSACDRAELDNSDAPVKNLPSAGSNIIPKQVIPPNFDEEENGIYFYIAAINEEDRKKGKAAGDVVAFRYLGKNEKDEYVIASIDQQNDRIKYKNYCKNPCKIIRSDAGEPFGFNRLSIIGAAFEDAIEGRLEISPDVKSTATDTKSKATKPEKAFPKFVSSVPKVFHGRWDEIIEDKCEAREARFYFEDRKFGNFEVQWEVSGVKLYSPTEMDMSTTAYDENQNQISDTWEFKLVDEGKTLTGRKQGTSFFKKCP